MVANSNTVHNCFLMQFNLKMDAVMFPDLYPDWDHVTFGVCVNINFLKKVADYHKTLTDPQRGDKDLSKN